MADVEKQVATSEQRSEQKAAIMLICLEVCIMVAYALFAEYDQANVAPQATAGAASNLQAYYPMFQDVHVMIFVGFGFLMTFMKRYAFSAVGFNFLLSVVTIQYSILIVDFCHRLFAEGEGHWDNKIQVSITSLVAGDFAAGAVLISFGAVLGKLSFEQLVMMVILEIPFFGLNEAICVNNFKSVDMGGSMIVHTFGAYFGLGVALMSKKKGKVDKASDLFGSNYNSDLFAMVGTLFLWMFWPSFNGVLAEGTAQHRVVINTVLSLTNSCLGAFIASRLLQPGGKLSMVDVQNATLAGGVAVGSCADLVINPHGALVIGFIAGFLSVYGYVKVSPMLEEKLGLHDTCGVHNLHGMPGVMGALCSVVVASMASTDNYKGELESTFSLEANERKAGDQGMNQLLALICTLVLSCGGGAFAGVVIDKLFQSADEDKPNNNELPSYAEDSHQWGDCEADDYLKADDLKQLITNMNLKPASKPTAVQ